MTTYKNIPIKNIYYMLAYAFKEIKSEDDERIKGEEFENIYDLFAEILTKGVSYLLKQGLHKEYITKHEVISTLKGKLNLQETIKEKLAQRLRLACEYDEFTINNIYNQIIKSTIFILLSKNDVKTERKQKLRKLMLFFDEVEQINLKTIKWKSLRYDRNNRIYQFLHKICEFIVQSKLFSTEDGEILVQHFSEKGIALLFQRFVLEYYRQEHPEYNANSKEIKWCFTECENNYSNLPKMMSDIKLTGINGRDLIIDTKFYSKNMQENYGEKKIISHNLYQIFSYVMNEDKEHKGEVDGMLLYARTDADLQPKGDYTTPDGNKIMIRTLDLSKDFEKIKKELDDIVNYISLNKDTN